MAVHLVHDSWVAACWDLLTATRLLSPSLLPPPPAASKGNKTERAGALLFSLVIGLPVMAMYIYFVNFQTYVCVWGPSRGRS